VFALHRPFLTKKGPLASYGPHHHGPKKNKERTRAPNPLHRGYGRVDEGWDPGEWNKYDAWGRQEGKVTPELEGRSSKSGEIAAVHGVRQPQVDLRQEPGHGGRPVPRVWATTKTTS
jgi:hypothetical protein